MESERPREIRRFLEDGKHVVTPQEQPALERHRLLAGNEEILYQTGKHWIVFVKALLYLCLAISLFASRGSLLKYIPYASAYESAREATGSVTQPNANERLLPAQTMDEIKRIAALTGTWAVSGASIALAFVLAFLGVARALGFFSCQVIITTKRIIVRDALLGALASFALANVESARADSGLFGPILGYGKVALHMSSGRKVSMANLRRPMEFERELFGAK